MVIKDRSKTTKSVQSQALILPQVVSRQTTPIPLLTLTIINKVELIDQKGAPIYQTQMHQTRQQLGHKRKRREEETQKEPQTQI